MRETTSDDPATPGGDRPPVPGESEERPDGEPIMEATYRALCRCGYADLTMQAIADEWGKSTAALHYHYDTKRELLLAFLEYLLDTYERRIAAVDGDDPAARLQGFVRVVFEGEKPDGVREFRTAFLEIKAQGPYDDAYRERLRAFDRSLHERVRAAVAEGIERGQFREDVDPGAVADLFVAAITGAYTRQVAAGADTDGVEATLLDYVDARLKRGDDE